MRTRGYNANTQTLFIVTRIYIYLYIERLLKAYIYVHPDMAETIICYTWYICNSVY